MTVMANYPRGLISVSELECKIRISYLLMNDNVVKFKIGKTADQLDKRYNEDEEYKTEYDDIKLIYETENKALVDDLEKILIHDYRLTYPAKCANKQEGSGPDCEDSENPVARLYVVLKYKEKK